MEKYYDIYFDPVSLEVDRNGDLTNPNALHIICFGCNTDTGEAISWNRVNEKGEVIETEPDLRDLCNVGYGDDITIREALDRFEIWLENHLEWRESYHGDYYNPPEYICAGIEGYVDDEPRYHRFSHSWY